MAERKKPIHKRFPGQSAARLQFWLTDGSRVLLEGAFTTESITRAFSALLRGCADDERARLWENDPAKKNPLTEEAKRDG